MGKKREYEIGFTGLQDGKHEFAYKIEDEFFEQFEYTDIQGGELSLSVELEKKPDMLIVQLEVEGVLKVMCDRCTDTFEYPVSGTDEIIYKFSESELDDEKIIAIAPNEVKIDITVPAYEFIALLLPSRRVHPEGMCNQEMLAEMDNYLMVESSDDYDEEDTENKNNDDNDDIDPRWEQLKNLK